MKKRLVKRIFCGFLTLCLLTAYAFALTYGEPRVDSSFAIAQGTLYREGVWNSSGTRLNESYIEYSPSPATHPVVAYGSKLYGTSTYKTVASYLEEEGKTVSAVINGDYFNTSNGLPNGIVVTDGIVRGSDGHQAAVGFRLDGSAIIGKPSMKMSVSSMSFSGGISAINRALSSAGVFLYTPDFSATTRSNLKAVYVIMRPVSGELTLSCTVSAVVEEIKQASSPISIPEGCMILAATADNSNYAALSAMIPGEGVSISVSSAPGWADVAWAVGAKELLIENGSVVSSLASSAAPRTAAGIKADGSIVFYTVDGRQSDRSAGVGLSTLAKRMAELGCVTAVNLDGGGSTAMGIVIPGQDALTTMNSPSDGSLRKCANFIFIVNDAPATGFAQRLHIYPQTVTALPGATVSFFSGATDQNWHSANAGSITYTATGGTVSPNGVWTAPLAPGIYTVTANALGLSAAAQIEVVSAADKISLYRSSTKVNDKSITLAPGSVTDFSVAAWYLSKELEADDSLFAWSVSGGIGSIDSTGLFTASKIETGASGTITVTSGSASASVNISISGSCAIIEDFEAAENLYVEGEGAVLAVCTDLTKVKNGFASGSLTYAPAPDGVSPSSVFVDWPLTNELAWLCGWVKGDGSNNVVCAEFDGADELLYLCTLTSSEWTFFSAQLPSGAKAVKSLRIVPGEGKTAGEGTVWLDTIYQSKTGECDTFAPSIVFDEVDPTCAFVLDGAAGIPRQNISVKYDFTPVPFTYDPISGALAMDLGIIAPGAHLLNVTASDPYGNMNTGTVTLSGGDTISPFSDTDSHWANAQITYLYEQGIVTGSTRNGNYIFRPDEKITRQEFSAIVSRWMKIDTSLYADVILPFEDASAIDSWALPYVKAMYALGISTGSLEYGHLRFNPQSYLTRAQAMAMLGRTQPMGYDSPVLSFSDADEVPSWALPFISPLTGRGVINGSGGKLNPGSDVTRAEVAKMIYSMS